MSRLAIHKKTIHGRNDQIVDDGGAFDVVFFFIQTEIA